jgi:hypothetical protein
MVQFHVKKKTVSQKKDLFKGKKKLKFKNTQKKDVNFFLFTKHNKKSKIALLEKKQTTDLFIRIAVIH